MAITAPAEPHAAWRLARFLHHRLVSHRRNSALAAILADLVPPGATALDIGCGSGAVGYLLQRIKPTLSIRGLEVQPRPSCLIECGSFDGARIPLGDDSVDVCMFVDVLHHTENIVELLKEARRVARRYVLVKDHLCENRWDRALLSFMDRVGNPPRGVRMADNYKNRAEWDRIFASSGLRIARWNDRLLLFPPVFNPLFGRGLHYVGLFERC